MCWAGPQPLFLQVPAGCKRSSELRVNLTHLNRVFAHSGVLHRFSHPVVTTKVPALIVVVDDGMSSRLHLYRLRIVCRARRRAMRAGKALYFDAISEPTVAHTGHHYPG